MGDALRLSTKSVTHSMLKRKELGRGLKSPGDLAQLTQELLKITVEASLNAK
jgi:hypothetical protein